MSTINNERKRAREANEREHTQWDFRYEVELTTHTYTHTHTSHAQVNNQAQVSVRRQSAMQSTYDHRTGRVGEHSTGVPWVLQAVREDDPGRLWPLGDIGEAHSVTYVLELRSDPETPLAVLGHPLFGPWVGQEHWRVGPNPKRLRYLVAGIKTGTTGGR